MGLRQALRLGRAAPRLRPQVTAWTDRSHLEAIVWADVLGAALLPVTRAEAMTVPVFAKARHVVVSPARLPFAAVNASGVLQFQPDVIAQPNPAEPRAVTLTWTLDDLLWHGVSWWLVTSRYATGFPRTAERVDPLFVDVDDDGRVWVDGIGPWDDADVIRIDGPHEGLLTFGARAIRKAARIEAAAARTADNPVPLIELHNAGPDLDDAEIDELLAVWSSARLTATGGVGYTNASVELRVHGTPASELIAGERVASAVDAARLAGLPAASLDAPVEGGSTLSYDNPASRLLELLDLGLAAYTSAIEARLSMDDVLPRGTWCAFDVEAFRLSGGWSAGVRESALEADAPAALQAGAGSAGAPA